MSQTSRSLHIPPLASPSRLDRALARILKREFSRTEIARWIREGHVFVNGAPAKAALQISGGEEVTLSIPSPAPLQLVPEDLPLRIVYEDEHLVVVDKPAGMITHPAGPIRTGTLVNALLFHGRELSSVGGELRPGIVHRLDKGTSGLLVVAKSNEVHRRLAAALKARTVARVYEAVVWGVVSPAEFTLDAPIGRHPRDRKKMAVVDTGKPSRSKVHVIRTVEFASLLRVSLETGRTHQIRVHLAWHRHPVVGDSTYGGGKIPVLPSTRLRLLAEELRAAIDRPALHARFLRFPHPVTGESLEFESPLPADLEHAVSLVQKSNAAGSADYC